MDQLISVEGVYQAIECADSGLCPIMGCCEGVFGCSIQIEKCIILVDIAAMLAHELDVNG